LTYKSLAAAKHGSALAAVDGMAMALGIQFNVQHAK
jgi:hypothetical protein